ncbi:uncharacterized protein SCHCODRAFT_02598297 [Schizophyllum commune H4-8]|uniref:Uncharacterized protein n=1 Tax=Schizophyllum commune (strain H4-8 / FGSC 9210) TaxID=578458 RepID=D8Q0P1_SCHCM|nr:uncharacterized protein SCHCODRAFT_02598297 [Schizophyllum commune H4-8]KAI5895087.1 hypothetical protein SCHCODRAFT_02598297 [Schizophyllum commune H4-8]
MLSTDAVAVSALVLSGLAIASNEGQGKLVSFSPQGQTFECGFAVESDGNAVFLPSAVFDKAYCNKRIKASNPGGNGEAIEPVIAGIHDSGDALNGDATLYLTPDAFAKFVGGGVPHSPKDVEVVWDYE